MQAFRADRLGKLPPYLFVEIDRAKIQARQQGRDVIDFGVGDPDQPTPPFLVDRMAEAIRDPANHRYPLGRGKPAFREAVAAFMKRRFDVTVDPQTEVLAVLGTKEGIGHLATAVVNRDQTVLAPDPGYPVYTSGAVFCGARVERLPLRAEDGFLPRLDAIPASVCDSARLLWLNYPNNPTSACATLAFYERAVAFAKEHGLLIAQDAAYSELFFDDPPPSMLQVPGAKDCCVEFHSLSKTFSMTGWRIGFSVGNADAIAALADVKSNLDSGVFGAVQDTAVTALENPDHPQVHATLDAYRRRRDVLVSGLRELGWTLEAPRATFYVWAPCPAGLDSMTMAKRLLSEADVVVIPGIGFGPGGEGFIRFALTVDTPRIEQALERLKKRG